MHSEAETLRRFKLASAECSRIRANVEEAREVFRKHGLDPDEEVSDAFVEAVLSGAISED